MTTMTNEHGLGHIGENMYKYEYLAEHAEDFCDLLVECFMKSVKSQGRSMYEIYFANGKIEHLKLVWSDNGYRAQHTGYDVAGLVIDGIGINRNDYKEFFGDGALAPEALEAEKERFIQEERDQLFTAAYLGAFRESVNE